VSEKEQIIRKSGILEFFPVSENLMDVGGMDYLKRWLQKRGHAFPEKARVFGTFLTWQQEKSVPVFTIVTCNSVENLPSELLRKERFDEIFFVDLPSDAERREIFSIHIKKRNRDTDTFDLDTLSKVSSGFSGAEIEQAVISGMFDVLTLLYTKLI